MTPVSRRYNKPLLMVMAPVMISVMLHSYRDWNVDDCSNVSALVPPWTIGQTRADRDEWMRSAYRAIAWDEGTFREEPSLEFEFAMVRSYDPKKLYHRPEHSFRKGSVETRSLEYVERPTGTVPVHVLRYEASTAPTEGIQIAAYLLAYNAQPVANPYLAQVTAFPIQLVGGTRPMTLFILFGKGPARERAALENRAKTWLAEAWDRYRSACIAPVS